MVTKENDEILWKLFLDDSTHVEEFLEMALSSLSNQIPAYLFQNIMIPVSVRKIQVESLKFQDSSF